MPYTKTDWKDRVVEKPLTFTMQDNGDGTTTLIPTEGTIIDPGTPITATALNNLEIQHDEALNWVKSFGLGTNARSAPSDLNTITETGFYIVGTETNRPADFGTLLHIKRNNDATQLFVGTSGTEDGAIYTRKLSGGSGLWSNWRKVVSLTSAGQMIGIYNSFFRAHNNVNQTINGNSGTHSKMSLDTVVLDRHSEFGTASDRFTAKEAGVYNVRIWLQTTTAPTGFLFSRIYHNGVNYGIVGASEKSFYSQGNIQLSMAAGDYLEFYAEASGGSALTIAPGNYVVWVYKMG